MLVNAFRPKHVALGRFRCVIYRTLTTSGSLHARPRHLILEGRDTTEAQSDRPLHRLPYYFESGYSIFAKRPSRPFPPPFVSAPSGSFSDPLTTHNRVRDRKPKIDGKYLKGITNGDDAIIISNENFMAVDDGVGAWAQKEKGHAALWSRLIAHYWAEEAEKIFETAKDHDPDLSDLKPIEFLQVAFEATKTSTKTQTSDILGTTTATSVLLHHNNEQQPVVLVTQLGDCAAFIIRPPEEPLPENPPAVDGDGDNGNNSPLIKAVVYKTKEQWHWFDCPRQLGTNSPDTPTTIAVCDTVAVQPSDIVICVSDGVTDNLWEHEIVSKILNAWFAWHGNQKEAEDGVVYMARQLMNAARVVAQDPYAESPYMERALDEGIAAEGGKLDDISVVVGIVRKRQEDGKADDSKADDSKADDSKADDSKKAEPKEKEEQQS